jgi:hypothetical protein
VLELEFDLDLHRLASVRRLAKDFGYKGTRQQKQTEESIAPHVELLRTCFPTMGARRIVHTLRRDAHIKVPEYGFRLIHSRLSNKTLSFIRSVVASHLKRVEPDAVAFRKSGKFKRKRFFGVGVMELITMDQHDKWKRFGLWLHLGLDPFSGRIAWLKIWWNNRNPRLITSYYLEAARREGGTISAIAHCF